MRSYLAEFLADPRVVGLPRWLWLPILHGIVLRTRPAKSAHKYAQIWTPEGSPLAVHTARQAKLLAEKTGMRVECAMRYGEPSMASGLAKLRDCEELTVLPLYPQYSESATGSVLAELPGSVRVVRSFHDHPAYIGALAARVHRHWEQHGRAPILVMSFHGLPKRAAGTYREQCEATARLLANALGLSEARWRLTFQSRFGHGEWLGPPTEATLVDLARGGERRVDVVCPGFVSDCLETLEEIGIQGRARFEAAGGAELRLVPCLNESPEWIAALAQIAAEPGKYLGACCVFKGELAYLREWLEYHRIVGVERFYMVSNDDSPDAALALLRPYIERGEVVFAHRPGGPFARMQPEIYLDVIVAAMHQVRWLAFLDADEFLVPVRDESVQAVLRDYERYPAIAVNTACFGSSGLQAPPPLQTAAYTMRLPEGHEDNRIFKSIVDPKRVAGSYNPHRFHLHDAAELVDEFGAPVKHDWRNENPRYFGERLRINHYRLRSAQEFAEKLARWRAGGHPELGDPESARRYRERADANQVEDTAIQRFVPELRRRLETSSRAP